jgi:hypothetical protein
MLLLYCFISLLFGVCIVLSHCFKCCLLLLLFVLLLVVLLFFVVLTAVCILLLFLYFIVVTLVCCIVLFHHFNCCCIVVIVSFHCFNYLLLFVFRSRNNATYPNMTVAHHTITPLFERIVDVATHTNNTGDWGITVCLLFVCCFCCYYFGFVVFANIS